MSGKTSTQVLRIPCQRDVWPGDRGLCWRSDSPSAGGVGVVPAFGSTGDRIGLRHRPFPSPRLLGPENGHDGEKAMVSELLADWQKATHVFQNSLPIIGALHITGNLVQKFSDLPVWTWFEPLLTPLSEFLHSPNYRKQLIQTCCLPKASTAIFAASFQGRFPKMAQWRWGLLIDVLQSLARCQAALRYCFSMQAFLESEAGSSEKPSRVKLEKVQEAVTSSKFWGCLHMLLGVQRVIERFASWSEGRDCHAHADEHTTSSQRRREFCQQFNPRQKKINIFSSHGFLLVTFLGQLFVVPRGELLKKCLTQGTCYILKSYF